MHNESGNIEDKKDIWVPKSAEFVPRAALIKYKSYDDIS